MKLLGCFAAMKICAALSMLTVVSRAEWKISRALRRLPMASRLLRLPSNVEKLLPYPEFAACQRHFGFAGRLDVGQGRDEQCLTWLGSNGAPMVTTAFDSRESRWLRLARAAPPRL